jgi:hypothetical protein
VYPEFGSKRLLPAFGGLSSQLEFGGSWICWWQKFVTWIWWQLFPGFGGQILFLDLVAKVCYLHLVANVAKFLVVLSEGAAPQDL